jgi:hypothetical protein
MQRIGVGAAGVTARERQELQGPPVRRRHPLSQQARRAAGLSAFCDRLSD